MYNICNNIKKIKDEINLISNEFSISVDNVKIIAVSKNQSIEKIEEAILCGQIDFAENYIQEAEEKWLNLKKKYPQIKLHFIGNLQSNKARRVLEIFDVIHTLDNIKLAKKISYVINDNNLTGRLFLVQILLDEDSTTKHGLNSGELTTFLEECKNLHLNIAGLMGVAPINNPSPYFAFTKQLASKHNLSNLSMGMSNDYKQALKFGSNMLRLGKAIFGDR